MALKKTKFGSSIQLALGRFFSIIPLSPNQITVLALLFAAAGFYAAYLGLPFHSLALFLFAGAIDAIDGAVARFRKQVSDRGAYIDGIIDRLVEFLFILSFFFFLPGDLVVFAGICLIAILFFGTCLTSFATAYAEHRHVADAKKIARQPGILPRAERLI
ncbi:MAG: CDP-alcohol phosphatidyltransferase family protein, partial [Candidatus Micrarchaeota archaeon]|nr:CDP-alcohol phosphatidyltransferase family protein [Candidatus Micrarchaeota archaeon]